MDGAISETDLARYLTETLDRVVYTVSASRSIEMESTSLSSHRHENQAWSRGAR